MSAVDRWAASVEQFGLVPARSPEDAGVLMLYDTDTATGKFPAKVGLIVIRDEKVTYAELDGHVMDSITADRRPINIQLSEAIQERAGRK